MSVLSTLVFLTWCLPGTGIGELATARKEEDRLTAGAPLEVRLRSLEEEGHESKRARTIPFRIGRGHSFCYLQPSTYRAKIVVLDSEGKERGEASWRPGRSALVSLTTPKEEDFSVRVLPLDEEGGAVTLVLTSSLESKEAHAYTKKVMRWIRARSEPTGREGRGELMSRMEEFRDEIAGIPHWNRSWHVGHTLWHLAKFLHRHQETRWTKEFLERALRIYEFLLPTDHEETLVIKLNLAQARYGQSDYERALKLQEEVLRDFADAAKASPLGSELNSSMRVAKTAQGSSLNALGRLEEARIAFEEVLGDLGDSPLDEKDFDTFGDLLTTMKMLGDRKGARVLEEKLLSVASEVLDHDHPTLTRLRRMCAQSLRLSGDYQGALLLAEKVVSVAERTLPPLDLCLQLARQELAAILETWGDLEAAYELHKQILAVAEERSRQGENEHGLLCAKAELASTLSNMGELEKAATLRDEIVEAMIKGKVYPPYSLRTTLHRGMWDESTLGREDKAARHARLLIDCLKHRIHDLIPALSFREIEAAATLSWWPIDGLLSWTGAREEKGCLPEWTPEIFGLIEAYRGVGLLSTQHARLQPDTANETRRDLVRSRSALVERGLRGLSEDDFVTDLIDVEKRERARRRKEGTHEVALPLPDASNLLSHLRESEAGVGFWRYRRYGWPVDDLGQDHLVAFVLRHGSGVRRFELGRAAAIDDAVADWRRAANREGIFSPGRGIAGIAPKTELSRAEEAGLRLRRLIFDPIAESLRGARSLLVALDGSLLGTSIECLPLEQGAIGDHFEVSVVSSLSAIAFRRARSGCGSSFLGFGGIDYNAPLLDGASKEQPAPGIGESSEEEGFSELEWTQKEVRSILSLFTEHGTKDATVLEGSAATKKNLFRLAPSASFLHIATHGYFKPSSLPTTETYRVFDTKLGLGSISDPRSSFRSLAPLTSCRLALAGANQWALPGGEAGIVTAEELRALRLSKCRLVVLSACETSTGEPHLGQGAQSLQKSLHAAGAQVVIASLWPVSDKATTDLMISFYRKLLTEGSSIARAFWLARMEISSRRNFRDWAGWVVSGVPE